MKKTTFSRFLLLCAALAAVASASAAEDLAVKITELPTTNAVSATDVIVVDTTPSGVVETWQTPLSSVRAYVTNGMASLATVANASNTLVSSSQSYAQGITNGLASLATVQNASNAVVSYVGTSLGGQTLTTWHHTNAGLYMQAKSNATEYLTFRGGNAGFKTNNPGATVHIFGSTEPQLKIVSSADDISHLTITGPGGMYAAIDSAGQAGGRLNLFDQTGTSKLLLSPAGESYLKGGQTNANQFTIEGVTNSVPLLIKTASGTNVFSIDTQDAGGGGRAGLRDRVGTLKVLLSSEAVSYVSSFLGVGITTPTDQLHVDGRARVSQGLTVSGNSTNDGLFYVTGEMYFATNTPARNLVIDANRRAISGSVTNTDVASDYTNRVLVAPITATNQYDWAKAKWQHVTITTNTAFTLINTNLVEGNELTVYCNGEGPFNLYWPEVPNLDTGVSLPSTITSNQFFTVRFRMRDGRLHAAHTFDPGITIATNGVGSGSAPVLNLVAGAGIVLTSTNASGTNTVGVALTGGVGEANTMSNSGGVGLVRPKSAADLPLRGFNANQGQTNETEFFIKSGALLTNVVNYGSLQLSGNSRLVSLSDGAFSVSNAANSSLASLTVGAVTASSLSMSYLTDQWFPASYSISNASRTTYAWGGGATFATFEYASPTNRMLDCYVFGGGVTNAIQILWRAPRNWNAGTVRAMLTWTTTNTAATITNVWAVSGTAASHDDPLSIADWGTAQTAISPVTAANDLIESPATSAITIAGTPSPGDWVWFLVRRLGAHADDSDAAPSRLIGLTIQHTLTSVGVSAW